MQVNPSRAVARWLWVMLIVVCSACQSVAIKPNKGLPDKAEARPLGEQPRARTALQSNVAALTELANSGDPVAQYRLGFRYAKGQGIPKDERKAVFWFRKAADQGHAVSQCNLGVMYANGQGVAKDESQSVFWYRKAADQGDAWAEYYLGVSYAKGTGVRKDLPNAMHWLRLAVQHGNPEAVNAIRALSEMPSANRSEQPHQMKQAERTDGLVEGPRRETQHRIEEGVRLHLERLEKDRQEEREREREQAERQRQIDENYRRQQEMARQDDERRARQQEFQRQVDRDHGY